MVDPVLEPSPVEPVLEQNVHRDDSSEDSSSGDGDEDEDGDSTSSNPDSPPPTIAVCMSGAVRSFPRDAFRASFEQFRKEMPPFDVFVVLKMSCAMGTLLNSEEGVECFMRTMRALRPKAVILFDRHADPSVDASSYASQLVAIDESFRLAEAHGEYRYFMRYRPDFIMMDTRLDWSRVRDDTIYTCRKLDAPASDQAFLVSRALKAAWWGKRFRLDDTQALCPEYYLFNTPYPVQNGPCFCGGLLRPSETEHVLMWEQAPEEHQGCSFLRGETRKLPLSHEPLQARFRDMIRERMLELHCVRYVYVSELARASS
jgi:hypothetical protein